MRAGSGRENLQVGGACTEPARGVSSLTMAALLLSLLGLSALLLTASGVVVQLNNENFDQVASKGCVATDEE